MASQKKYNIEIMSPVREDVVGSPLHLSRNLVNKYRTQRGAITLAKHLSKLKYCPHKEIEIHSVYIQYYDEPTDTCKIWLFKKGELVYCDLD